MVDGRSEIGSWIDHELAGSRFSDERLGKRLRNLAEQLGSAVGAPLPFACRDWANTKAAYRFLSNDDVDESQILAGHFLATGERIRATDGPILMLQDTTEFTFNRRRPKDVGFTKSVNSGRDKNGRVRHHALCGILMHSSLAVTEEGLPLGLAAVKFWNRDKFRGTAQLKRKINPTRVPIEAKESIRWLDNLRQSIEIVGNPGRCVHVGDRESDIYELYCLAKDLGAHFVVRTVVDRLAGDGEHTIKREMAEAPSAGRHVIETRDETGAITKITLDVKYKRIHVLPPIGKQKRYPALDLTVIHATEISPPAGREPILWKLVTDLEVTNLEGALEKIRWYAMRWKIETFHKILKSGCRAEDVKLRTATRLANLIAIFCIISWRIFWMTMAARILPKAPPTLVFTEEECTILAQTLTSKNIKAEQSLEQYSQIVARLGGYMARSHDPPPGNLIMWRGWRRLTDMALGFKLAAGVVGN
jgi:hypothetical protein